MSAKQNNTSTSQQVMCFCEKRCRGGKLVSRQTYRRHNGPGNTKKVNARPQAAEPDTLNHHMANVHPRASPSESPPRTLQEAEHLGHVQPEFVQGSSTRTFPSRRRPSLPETNIPDDGGSNHSNVEPTVDRGSLRDTQQREAQPDNNPSDSEPEEEEGPIIITLTDLKDTVAFIDAIKGATLDNGGLPAYVIERLRNPPRGPPVDLDLDPDLRHSLELFIACMSGSEHIYDNARDATLRRHPDNPILTSAQVKRTIEDLTGVIAVKDDMCKNSCLAFTGPYADLTTCPLCETSRYKPLHQTGGKPRIPQAQFDTILLGPQLQALWASRESATAMRYRQRHTAESFTRYRNRDKQFDIPLYDDIFSGTRYLAAVDSGELKPEDMTLMYSIDGAQLYAYKQSDIWIFVWIILDLPPELRYKKKHVLPGGFIPGPNKPKILDSFIFRSFHHLAALQKEGVRIWDALEDKVFTSRPWFVLCTADAMAQCEMDGTVGHRGKSGCRYTCKMEGRHAPGDSTHYMSHLAPDNYTVPNCSHEDFDIDFYSTNQRLPQEYQKDLRSVLESTGPTQYNQRRRKTGIVKPTLISGLPLTFGIPGSFGLDLMHLMTLNLTDLLLVLWRGTIPCGRTDSKASWNWAVLQGDTWETHGKAVADATPYLPGSFDRVPRNPAKKVSTGYKAWEFLLYIYGLGPALLYNVLPHDYWRNFCSLVRAVRLLHQKSITSLQLALVNVLLKQFVRQFEELYYQRRIDRMHFCRVCIHLLIHCAPETVQLGPLPLRAQWTMERTIGNLGQDIKQDSNPFANMSQCGLLRCQMNALYAIYPQITPPDKSEPGLPSGSEDLHDGYVLLRARDQTSRTRPPHETIAIEEFILKHTGIDYEAPKIMRWARLRLPNRQIARSAWKENMKSLDELRVSRNVKITLSNKTRFAEVQYFFQLTFADNTVETLALVSLYGDRDELLFESSFETVWACPYQGNDALIVIPTRQIESVVAMVPMNPSNAEASNLFFVVEKPGLETRFLTGVEEELVAEE